MDYHSIKLRLGFTACRRDTVRGGAKEGGIPNTHKQASIVHIPPRQRREKKINKKVNLSLKDNLGQIIFSLGEEKHPLVAKQRENRRGAQTFVLTKV